MNSVETRYGGSIRDGYPDTEETSQGDSSTWTH